MSKGWDNTMLKKLKALTGKGLSTSEIGKRLGMSKNAIVGKLNRLGWNAKAGGANVVAEKSTKATTSKKATTKTSDKAGAKKSAPAAKVATSKKTASATKTVSKKVATTTKVAAKKEPAKKGASAPKATAEKSEKKTTAANAKTLAMHQRIVQHSLEMANLKPNQCRWPIGDPDSEHFHFCGETVFVGKPYCYEHCKQAYQFTPPKKK